ncbi:MAG: pilus assembly protein, partial [Alphaproteobacteria bacterium]|nr:pilus assembly protein [Alphaproteobacteria bacterium]
MAKPVRWYFGQVMRSMRGAAALEFVLMTPVFLGMSGALLEFSYDSYVQSQISGVVSKAARDVTLEGQAD